MAPGLRVALAQHRPIRLEVSLECGPGELLVLVGPSGSGKTTVLRCIAGLHHPERGEVTCGGSTWLDTDRKVSVTPQRRGVGLVFQHYALFPHLRALENVTVAMTHLAVARRVPRARELLALVNMEGLEGRRPDELSGGQRQRVALARALARDPAVLLLDEPFSAVDQMTRRRLRRELAQLRHTLQIPVVLVTHDLDEAQMLADRVTLLHRGHTLQSGPTREVMRRPVSAEAARLLDQTNVFSARIVSHEPQHGRTWIESDGLRLECAHTPEFAVGEPIDWLVPPSDVVLHRRDRPSRGERENPLRGTVSEFVILGDEALVNMDIDELDDTLSFTVSVHVAGRNRVGLGEPIGVSLLASGIHIMKRSAAD